jgi:hypothetical protein
MRLWARREEMGKWVNVIIYMIKQWKNNYIVWKSGIWLLYAPNGNPFRAPISQNHPIAWRDSHATAQSWHNPRENRPGIDASAWGIVSRGLVLGDQADGGHDDAPVRRVESYRRLDGRKVVVEAPRVEGKDLEKEFESIASEGPEGHWVIGRKAAKRRRDGQREGRWNNAEWK